MKHSNPLFSSIRLSVLLFIWVIVAAIIPNVWLSITEDLSLVQRLTNIILPLGVYTLLMSITRRVGKASLWMIIAFFFAAFQIVLLYMYGRSVIAVDMFLNVVTTNPGEVTELLGNMLLIMLFIVLIYIPPIAMGIIAVIKKWRLPNQFIAKSRPVGVILTAIGIVLFGCSFFSTRAYKPQNDLFPVNALYNISLAAKRTVKVASYHDTSAGYTYNASSERPDSISETYVLVIGETSRADNWQILGYDRETTPRLMNIDGLTTFPRAISQSNTTHKSVPMMLSPLSAKNFGDSIYYVKSLITAFKEAGFHTAFFSNHSRNHSFIDFFGEEADTVAFIKDDESQFGAHYDGDLLKYLDNSLNNSHKKKLIVLHTYGSHFNYIDRYPEAEAKFLPDRPAEATHHFRDKQINAYDNTILYTSNLLADIIQRLQQQEGLSAMMYASDHGEDIFDDSRRLFLHASPIPSYYQIHVPMLVWRSESFSQANPQIDASLNANKDKFVASSKAFFHTAMQLAGIKSPTIRRNESVADSTYTPSQALYLNDHNQAVELKDCGITDIDIQLLDSLRADSPIFLSRLARK